MTLAYKKADVRELNAKDKPTTGEAKKKVTNLFSPLSKHDEHFLRIENK